MIWRAVRAGCPSDIRGGLNFALLLNGETGQIRLDFCASECGRSPAAEGGKIA
jgi:hypothetical protein